MDVLAHVQGEVWGVEEEEEGRTRRNGRRGRKRGINRPEKNTREKKKKEIEIPDEISAVPRISITLFFSSSVFLLLLYSAVVREEGAPLKRRERHRRQWRRRCGMPNTPRLETQSPVGSASTRGTQINTSTNTPRNFRKTLSSYAADRE